MTARCGYRRRLALLSGSYVTPPAGWSRSDAAGLGPFVTRERFRAPDGTVVEWSSREHRKQAGRLDAGRGSTWWAPDRGRLVDRRAVRDRLAVLRRRAPLPGYVDWVGTDADAITFFVGSLFFTTAASCSTSDGQRAARARRRAGSRERVRFWTWEPRRIDWWASAVQLVGTVFFNVTHARRASTRASTRRRRTGSCGCPTCVGSICFLVASGLAWFEVSHGWWSWRPAQPLVVDRRAQPRRFDRVRRVGGRVEGRADHRRAAQHHARQPRDRRRRRLLPRRRAVPAPRTHPSRSTRPSPDSDHTCTEPRRSPWHCTARSPTSEHRIERSTRSIARAEEARTRRATTLPDGELDPDVAYQLVHDELMLDGNARLNLATFVTTWMEPQAQRLMAETFDKNMIDKDEYPRTAELEMRCVNMLSRLWNSPDDEEATGTSTTGSSEAAMLGGHGAQVALARPAAGGGQADRQAQHGDGRQRAGVLGEVLPLLGRRDRASSRWRATATTSTPRRRSSAATRTPSASSRCSARRSTAATSRSPRSAPRSTSSRPTPGSTSPCTSTARRAGSSRRSSTPTSCGTSACRGCSRSTRRATSTGSCTRASAGSIWRNPDALPDDLVFNVNYLGGDMPTFALNFSRPGNQIVAQYYNFLRLGFDGYRRVQQASRDVARVPRRRDRARSDQFELITDGSELPVFAFTLKPGIEQLHRVRRLGAPARPRAGWSRRTRSPRTARTSPRCASSCATASRATSPTCSIADLQRHTDVLRQAHVAAARRRRQELQPLTMGRLDGKVVVVIGGAQGIGRGCVLAAASEGAHVVLGDLNERRRAARSPRKRPPAAPGPSAWAATWSTARASTRWWRPRSTEFGRLDGLVNLAYAHDGPAPLAELVDRLADPRAARRRGRLPDRDAGGLPGAPRARRQHRELQLRARASKGWPGAPRTPAPRRRCAC